jgi:hypothetical protein
MAYLKHVYIPALETMAVICYLWEERNFYIGRDLDHDETQLLLQIGGKEEHIWNTID